jgi:hypothetical protein
MLRLGFRFHAIIGWVNAKVFADLITGGEKIFNLFDVNC